LGATDICGDGIDQDCSGSDLNCNSDLISKYMEIKHNPMCPSFEDVEKAIVYECLLKGG